MKKFDNYVLIPLFVVLLFAKLDVFSAKFEPFSKKKIIFQICALFSFAKMKNVKKIKIFFFKDLKNVHLFFFLFIKKNFFLL